MPITQPQFASSPQFAECGGELKAQVAQFAECGGELKAQVKPKSLSSPVRRVCKSPGRQFASSLYKR
jgi:hypothetical protein